MSGRLRILRIGVLATIVLGFVVIAFLTAPKKSTVNSSTGNSTASSPTASPLNGPAAAIPQFRHQSFGDYTLWWDPIPEQLRQVASTKTTTTNIHPHDYSGPDACKSCHKKQYESWSTHPHRWMNSLVENTTIRGNFDNQKISYLGGEVTFYKDAEKYRMRLERGDVRREYVIEQTIGSRFFQYYIGKQLEGPEATDHPLYSEAHVLPLGYWIDRQEWVPAVHVGSEPTEAERHDPYVPRAPYSHDMDEYAENTLDLYRSQCNFCHTTFPLGDMFVRFPRTIGRHIPTLTDVSLEDYVTKTRPEMWPANRTSAEMSDDDFATVLREFHRLDATKHAVTLGVSCEACHLGAKEHAEGKLKRPQFFPSGPEVVVRSKTSEYDLGRTHDNVNWACGRCHAGNRPQYANGTATWNSTEYTDAMRGSCYSKLTCVHCHNPHEAIGHEWSKPPAHDDGICLSCHQKFEPDDARVAHTHHPLNHEGSRCMNCHMPRFNEGLQEVVRTHTISTPTNRAMIESNQMNACNMCHVDQSIDWTLSHLKDWYGDTFDEQAINANYPDRKKSAAIGWMASDKEAVRLVAADALARADARWALPELLRALDDPFILNRQFARIGLEKMLKLKLSDFGYQFFQTPKERVDPIQKLREHLLPGKVETEAKSVGQ